LSALAWVLVYGAALVVVVVAADLDAHRGEHRAQGRGRDLATDAVGVLVTRCDAADIGELGQGRGYGVVLGHGTHCATGASPVSLVQKRTAVRTVRWAQRSVKRNTYQLAQRKAVDHP